ncbi:MAG: VOC family protein, partial [Albidovulum sp.]
MSKDATSKMVALAFDHLAFAAETLDEGREVVEAALGVPLGPVGHHASMSTHNRLLGLGPGEYFEVIAIDPAAPPVAHPRWFDLDRFKGAPKLTNWILRCDDLDRALAAAPAGAGQPVALERGDFRWRMGVPATGCLPYDNAFPALIEWQGRLHPSDRLPDSGCRLQRLEVAHPDALALRKVLPLRDPRVVFVKGPNAI